MAVVFLLASTASSAMMAGFGHGGHGNALTMSLHANKNAPSAASDVESRCAGHMHEHGGIDHSVVKHGAIVHSHMEQCHVSNHLDEQIHEQHAEEMVMNCGMCVLCNSIVQDMEHTPCFIQTVSQNHWSHTNQSDSFFLLQFKKPPRP